MVFGLANKIIERTQYTTLIAAVISGARPAMTAAESIPGGSVAFANSVVLPAEDAAPRPAPCVAQL
jgi:hypothetical protein